nr:unnamed protein product [Callosobruchus analis]
MLRDHGQQYFSPFKKVDVPERTMKQRCTSERCLKNRKQCSEIDDGQRKKIFSDYYNLADLTRQRSFLIQHVTKENVKRKTKDQCTLCVSFREGDEKTKLELKEAFEQHIKEKHMDNLKAQ